MKSPVITALFRLMTKWLPRLFGDDAHLVSQNMIERLKDDSTAGTSEHDEVWRELRKHLESLKQRLGGSAYKEQAETCDGEFDEPIRRTSAEEQAAEIAEQAAIIDSGWPLPEPVELVDKPWIDDIELPSGATARTVDDSPVDPEAILREADAFSAKLEQAQDTDSLLQLVEAHLANSQGSSHSGGWARDPAVGEALAELINGPGALELPGAFGGSIGGTEVEPEIELGVEQLVG